MEITARSLWTAIHGMLFGALYLLACSGALVKIYRLREFRPGSEESDNNNAMGWYFAAMSLLAWLAVLTGTYAVYPWYRSVPPAGAIDPAAFPQKFLIAQPATRGWHSLGMEWKEHIAWLVPITITMATVVVAQYGKSLRDHPRLQSAVSKAVIISFVFSMSRRLLGRHD
jgi:hypothetical protein